MNSEEDKTEGGFKQKLRVFFGFTPQKFKMWMLSTAAIIFMEVFYYFCRFERYRISRCFFIEDITFSIYGSFVTPFFDFSNWLTHVTGISLVLTEVIALFIFIYFIVSLLYYLSWKFKICNVPCRKIIIASIAALIFIILLIHEITMVFGLSDVDLIPDAEGRNLIINATVGVVE